MRWPWVVRSKDQHTITIVAPHQTPEGRKLRTAVFVIAAIFGLSQMQNWREAFIPLAGFYWPENTPQKLIEIASSLTLATIVLETMIMGYLIFPIFCRKPLIIKMNPEHIRVWHILWFRTYDRQRIGGFHLEQHEKVEIENRENQKRGNNPRYMYRDSVQIFMDYNNMPLIITSVYGAMQGRRLLGRIQAIFTETNIRKAGGGSAERH